jgi:hypothetical protein
MDNNYSDNKVIVTRKKLELKFVVNLCVFEKKNILGSKI